MNLSLKKIGITIGDPAGIGPEITLGAFHDTVFANRFFSKAIPIIFGHEEAARLIGERFYPALRLHSISSPREAEESGKIYFINTGPEGLESAGLASAWGGAASYAAISQVAAAVGRNEISALCTGPIHKGALRLASVSDIGHTEMLARLTCSPEPLTMFVTHKLRVFFYSRHLSLRQAIEVINEEGLMRFIKSCHDSLLDLGISKPKLALAALNPHASDGGQFGDEEERILEPAVLKSQKANINIVGPFGADSVFSQAKSGVFDAVLSLYHDQGHIAAKTYDFDSTISVTLGLPVLRASVDHGTAFDIAWKGVAQHQSMQCALSFLLDHI